MRLRRFRRNGWKQRRDFSGGADQPPPIPPGPAEREEQRLEPQDPQLADEPPVKVPVRRRVFRDAGFREEPTTIPRRCPPGLRDRGLASQSGSTLLPVGPRRTLAGSGWGGALLGRCPQHHLGRCPDDIVMRFSPAEENGVDRIGVVLSRQPIGCRTKSTNSSVLRRAGASVPSSSCSAKCLLCRWRSTICSSIVPSATRR